MILKVYKHREITVIHAKKNDFTYAYKSLYIEQFVLHTK